MILGVVLALLVTDVADAREYTIDVGGVARTYLVHAPAKRPRGKWPLVVLLHGGGGNAAQAMRAYGMNEVADREGFLVAYPNGTGNVLRTWNAGNCCGAAMKQRVDDVAFVRAMVAKIDRDFGVDRARIYATGMSNGAMMSYRLGCEATDLFAAIAPVAGALNIACKPKDRVAVAIFHGTADEHVPYDGGTGAKALEPRVDQPVSHAVDTWRNINACSTSSKPSTRGAIMRQRWTSCADEAEVMLVTIQGGGHAWPGGIVPRRRGADAPTREISASQEIWSFFKAHPKRP